MWNQRPKENQNNECDTRAQIVCVHKQLSLIVYFFFAPSFCLHQFHFDSFARKSNTLFPNSFNVSFSSLSHSIFSLRHSFICKWNARLHIFYIVYIRSMKTNRVSKFVYFRLKYLFIIDFGMDCFFFFFFFIKLEEEKKEEISRQEPNKYGRRENISII